MEKIVSEELFDGVAFMSSADDEVVDMIGGVNFHDVPENRHVTNLY